MIAKTDDAAVEVKQAKKPPNGGFWLEYRHFYNLGFPIAEKIQISIRPDGAEGIKRAFHFLAEELHKRLAVKMEQDIIGFGRENVFTR